MRIGIISDTHGLLRPAAIKQLAVADHIIHAGDIGAPEVIEGLRRIAPTTAVKGKIDAGEWAKDYPDAELAVIGGRAFYVLHNLKRLSLTLCIRDRRCRFRTLAPAQNRDKERRSLHKPRKRRTAPF
jgi:putative phosphoesterase